MKLVTLFFSGLLIVPVAEASVTVAVVAPGTGGQSFEAIAGGSYPLGSTPASESREPAFAVAAREAETASAAASSSALTAPERISIVPEPHPYQLLLGGVGAVFFMARRQWKR